MYACALRNTVQLQATTSHIAQLSTAVSAHSRPSSKSCSPSYLRVHQHGSAHMHTVTEHRLLQYTMLAHQLRADIYACTLNTTHCTDYYYRRLLLLVAAALTLLLLLQILVQVTAVVY
jgi:hypothetical protein